MELVIDNEFRKICETIEAEHKCEEDWASIESDDMFESINYNGGFDATEMEFCFSYYDQNQKEYWFQLSLSEVRQVLLGKKLTLKLSESYK